MGTFYILSLQQLLIHEAHQANLLDHFGPNGQLLGILYADLDLGEVVRGKFDFDVVGHYVRPDLF